MRLKPGDQGSGDARLETAISYLFIAGVVLSLALEIAGMTLYYRSYQSLNASSDSEMFIQGRNFYSYVYGLVRGQHDQKGALTLMALGAVALALTPYLRAIASLFYFAWRKDYRYTVITLFVLAVLSITLALH